MQTHKCWSFGCEQVTTFEAVSLEGLVVGGLCEKHGQEELAKNPTTFTLIKAGWEQDQEQEATPAPGPLMAPPNAIYDDPEENPEEEVYIVPDPITTTPSNHDREEKNVAPTTDEVSTNFFWRYGTEDTYELQTTVRSVLTEWQLTEHLRSVIGALKAVRQAGGRSKMAHAPAAPAQATPSAPIIAAPTPAGVAPTAVTPTPVGPVPIATPAATPTPAGGKPLQILGVSVMEITTRTDGKVDLGFYGPNDRYARVHYIHTPEEALQFLANTNNGWAMEHMTKPGKYNVAYNVTWQESEKLNQKGNPYKNAISVAKA